MYRTHDQATSEHTDGRDPPRPNEVGITIGGWAKTHSLCSLPLKTASQVVLGENYLKLLWGKGNITSSERFNPGTFWKVKKQNKKVHRTYTWYTVSNIQKHAKSTECIVIIGKSAHHFRTDFFLTNTHIQFEPRTSVGY